MHSDDYVQEALYLHCEIHGLGWGQCGHIIKIIKSKHISGKPNIHYYDGHNL